MSERPILAETWTPEGTRVVLFEDTWLRHILLPQDGHPELEPYLAAVLAVLPDPDHREPDPRPSRERFFKQGVGPSKWLMVVVGMKVKSSWRVAMDRARVPVGRR